MDIVIYVVISLYSGVVSAFGLQLWSLGGSHLHLHGRGLGGFIRLSGNGVSNFLNYFSF